MFQAPPTAASPRRTERPTATTPLRLLRTDAAVRTRVAVLIDGVHRVGLEVARQLGRDGRHVVLTGSRPAEGSALVQRLLLEGVAASHRYLDHDHEGDLERLVDDLRAVYGAVDTLVYHAGPGLVRRVPAGGGERLFPADPELMAEVVSRTVGRVVSLSRSMLPVMRGRGNGRIIYVIPEHGDQPQSQTSAWPDRCTVSAVVRALVRRLSSERGLRGVRVNGVALAAPGVRRRLEPSDWLVRRCAKRVASLATGDPAPQGKIYYSG